MLCTTWLTSLLFSIFNKFHGLVNFLHPQFKEAILTFQFSLKLLSKTTKAAGQPFSDYTYTFDLLVNM